MGKVTRGTLLATLKELKKHKRPKPITIAVSVQAICPKQVASVNKSAELRATVERRRALLNGGSSRQVANELIKFDREFDDFMVEYNKLKL